MTITPKDYGRVFVSNLGRTLTKNGISGKMARLSRGPRTMTASVRLMDPGHYKTALSSAEEIAVAIGASSVDAYHKNGLIQYEVTLPKVLWKECLLRDLSGSDSVGIRNDKGEVHFDIKEAPITMVIGESGSGKSNLIQGILIKAMQAHSPRELMIGLIDPHGQLNAFSGCAHLVGEPAFSSEDITNAFAWFGSELERRKSSGVDSPILCLVIDEASSHDVIGARGNINEHNLGVLRSLVKEGRKFGFRCMVVTQKPTEADLPGILSIATTRFVGRVSKAVGRGLANSDTAAPHNLSGNGDFYYVSAGGTVRFQAAMVMPQDYDLLKRSGARHYPEVEVEDVPAKKPVGRPKTPILGAPLAYYMTNDVTTEEAKERFNFGKTLHKRYSKLAKETNKALNRYKNDS